MTLSTRQNRKAAPAIAGKHLFTLIRLKNVKHTP